MSSATYRMDFHIFHHILCHLILVLGPMGLMGQLDLLDLWGLGPMGLIGPMGPSPFTFHLSSQLLANS